MLIEHSPLIEEPGSNYIVHVLPITSSSDDTTESITKFRTERRINFTTLLVLGRDETAVNTGSRGYVLGRIKKNPYPGSYASILVTSFCSVI